MRRTGAGLALGQLAVGLVLFLAGEGGLGIFFAVLETLGHVHIPLLVKSAESSLFVGALMLFVCRFAIAGSRGAELGFPFGHAPRKVLFGLVAGALLISLTVGVLCICSLERSIVLRGLSFRVVGTVAAFLVVSVGEETIFRGVLFRAVEEWLGSWAALLMTSLLFGVAHLFNPGASLEAALSIAVEAGLLLGAAYLVSGRSLWFPIGIHAAWNITLGPLFGLPVSGFVGASLFSTRLSAPQVLSGGSFGPEGGLVALGICTTAGVALIALAYRGGEWVPFRLTADASARTTRRPFGLFS